MANWNDRRGHRGRGPDDARENIHQGPWSPYNGRTRDDRRPRDDERDTWGARGRDYWIEDDRWEDRRMDIGDQWRHREDDQSQDENDESWGNRMGLREEPIERAGAWEREPRYGEMERMWSDRDDHPWPNERRARDEERREHRDYAHSRYSPRERRDDYARERGGEQYPRQTHQDWRDDTSRGWRDEEPRNWTERSERDRGERDRGEPLRSRTYQRGHDESYRGGDARYTRDDRGRVMGRDMQRRDMPMHGRDDRDMQRRDIHGRDDRDMQRRDIHGRDDRHPDRHRDDQGRGGPHGDDRSGAHFGGQRRARNRYD